MKGSTFKRCGCRSEDGRQLGRSCPRLGTKGHGRWFYVFDRPADEQGRRRQEKRGSWATKAEAEQELREAMGNADQGLRTDHKITTGEWLRFWLAERTKTTGTSAAGKPLRPNTAALYRQHIDYLLPHLGSIPLARLRPEHVSTALDAVLRDSRARGGRTMGPTTLRRVHAALRAALNTAVKSRRITWNPAVHVELPAADRPQVQPWTPLELGTFLDGTAAHRLGPLFEAMASTGMRRGEALGLRWSDLDLTAGVIVVRRQLLSIGGRVSFGPPKTTSGEGRLVELDSGTLGTLLALRLAQDVERAAGARPTRTAASSSPGRTAARTTRTTSRRRSSG